MSHYLLRRLLAAIPTLLIIITIAFFMMRAAPGGPFDLERALPPQIEKNVNAVYKLDQPLILQYFDYMFNVLRGDLGPSFKVRDFTVNELIFAGLPVSFRLGGTAIVLAIVLGMSLGTIAALKQNTRIDYAVMAPTRRRISIAPGWRRQPDAPPRRRASADSRWRAAMSGITLPNFVVAPLLTLVFGVYLSWLPVAGWSGDLRHAVLPVIALALPQIAYIARLTRGSMIEVLRSDYIRTARAKGLPERLTVLRHAWKGAMLPVVSYLGPATAGVVTGSVVIETIFDIPGVGRYFVNGALNRDYTLVMGTVIVYGSLIILLNLLVDLAYGLLDPKVRYE